MPFEAINIKGGENMINEHLKLYVFTYKNILGGYTTKTGIRDINKKDAKKQFITTHSHNCIILSIN